MRSTRPCPPSLRSSRRRAQCDPLFWPRTGSGRGRCGTSKELTSEPAKLGRSRQSASPAAPRSFAMLLYHLTWDLAGSLHLPPAHRFRREMRALSHVVASTSLALVGVSLALAHPGGLRRRAFARRFALIAGAALLVTAATYFSDPAEPVYFGILHCIAVASLIPAPFLGAPALGGFCRGRRGAGGAAPRRERKLRFPDARLARSARARRRALLDWRPLLPWAAVPVLVGLALARGCASRLADWPWTRRRPMAIPGRALDFAGRHSLGIYLIHQPILFALLFAAADVRRRRAAQRSRGLCE